jgi:uncharacterized protein
MENENTSLVKQLATPKNILIFISVILLFGVIAISILRERIVNENNDITTVIGRGKVSYQPDIEIITLGTQVNKAPTASEALNKLNSAMNNIVASAKALGIPEEDIETQAYSLQPHYDYQGTTGGITIPSGYDANQQVAIKAKGVDKNPDLASKIIESANSAGANQVIGITFDTSDLEKLKQEARIQAINDAKTKSAGLAQAAGIRKLGKVVSWYENVIQSPDNQNSPYGGGMGAGTSNAEKTAPSPQIPTGTQDIIIEMGLNYRIR